METMTENSDEWRCWYIERQRLDFKAILNIDLQIFTTKINYIAVFSALHSMTYFIIALILLISTLYNTYFLSYNFYLAIRAYFDSSYYHKCAHIALNDIDNRSSNKSANENKNQHKKNRKIGANINVKEKKNKEHIPRTRRGKSDSKILRKCFAKYYQFYFNYITPWYYIDSKWCSFNMLLKEWIEIFIQFYALLYGGSNTYSNNNRNTNNIIGIIRYASNYSIIINHHNDSDGQRTGKRKEDTGKGAGMVGSAVNVTDTADIISNVIDTPITSLMRASMHPNIIPVTSNGSINVSDNVTDHDTDHSLDNNNVTCGKYSKEQTKTGSKQSKKRKTIKKRRTC